MKNVCVDCIHWDIVADTSSIIRGKCHCDKFVYAEEDVCPKDGLEYWDYEGYGAGFFTGPNFGCIHWEES